MAPSTDHVSSEASRCGLVWRVSSFLLRALPTEGIFVSFFPVMGEVTTLAAFFYFSRGGTDFCKLADDHVNYEITSSCTYPHVYNSVRSSTLQGGRYTSRMVAEVGYSARRKRRSCSVVVVDVCVFKFWFRIFVCDCRRCCVFFLLARAGVL